MAETDILNPKRGFDPHLGDNINPNYGWNRNRTSTLAVAKSAGGPPYSRETGNAGRTYQLTFTRRNIKVMERLERFYEQFEQEFFTLIDWDSGRQFVGRFTGNHPVKLEASQRYTMDGWTFEEVPGAPMLEYPSEWERWAVMQPPWDGFGNLRTAFSGNWTRPASIQVDDGAVRTPNSLQNLDANIGDSVTHEYRGYGFRLWMNQGPTYGSISVVVDGVTQGTVNLYAEVEQGPQAVFTLAELPLGLHRVQVVIANNNVQVIGGGGGQNALTAPWVFQEWTEASQIATGVFTTQPPFPTGSVVTLSSMDSEGAGFLDTVQGVITYTGDGTQSSQFQPLTALSQGNTTAAAGTTSPGTMTLTGAAGGGTTGVQSCPVYLNAWTESAQVANLVFNEQPPFNSGATATLSGFPSGQGDFLNGVSGTITFSSEWNQGGIFVPTQTLSQPSLSPGAGGNGTATVSTATVPPPDPTGSCAVTFEGWSYVSATLSLPANNPFVNGEYARLSGFSGVATFLNGLNGFLIFPTQGVKTSAVWTLASGSLSETNVSGTDTGTATASTGTAPLAVGGAIYTGLEVMR